ncbi:SNARE-associated protein Snapin [Chiloscyllium plagiosum]|uniref:SNARE-associated protein Snapin n=1 Tax=Chiloscyllium plagiosum TaxID=36176 RepID=UPI001CB7C3E1|nr:SNARE-associated protein Snapin [Chiloscyllium plagiosum]
MFTMRRLFLSWNMFEASVCFGVFFSFICSELYRINEDQKVSLDLDPYVKKLLNARRRVVLVNNILQNAQERLRRLNHNVAKETARRKALLESGLLLPGSPSK